VAAGERFQALHRVLDDRQHLRVAVLLKRRAFCRPRLQMVAQSAHILEQRRHLALQLPSVAQELRSADL